MSSAFLYVILPGVRESGTRDRSPGQGDGPWDLVIPDGETSEDTMKTQGEIEAAICAGITRFEQEYMGRGPKTSAHT